MNNYCINQNDNISNRINSDIDKIALYLNNNIDCIESLVLAGGFGRGEGSVLVDRDRIQPINDYDDDIWEEVSEEEITSNEFEAA